MSKIRLYTFCAALIMFLCSGCGTANSVPMLEQNSQPEQTETLEKALPVQLTMQDMVDNGTEKDPVSFEYNSEGYLTAVTGRFAKEPVSDADAAFTLVASLSEVLQIGDVYDEIRLESQKNGMLNVYTFMQYYHDIPITDRMIRLTVRDESKEAVGLINGYVPALNIPLDFQRTAEDIRKQAAEIFSDNRTFFEPYPAICFGNHSMPSLVWEIQKENAQGVLLLRIDDQTGKILYQISEET